MPALLTDLYQLTMMQAYLEEGMADTAVFELFVRKLPPERGAASVDVAVTHALFVGDSLAELHAAGVRQVWSTDSVPHGSNVVSIASMVGRALARVASPTA